METIDYSDSLDDDGPLHGIVNGLLMTAAAIVALVVVALGISAFVLLGFCAAMVIMP